jgi:hypothetical protein
MFSNPCESMDQNYNYKSKMIFDSYIDNWCLNRRRLELRIELDQSKLQVHHSPDSTKVVLINIEINSELLIKSKQTFKMN